MSYVSAHPLTPFVQGFAKHFDLDVPSEVMPKLIAHVDALVFNIVAIACLVAKLNEKTIIRPEHLSAVEKYVDTRCTSLRQKTQQKGGESMPSDFYGYPHPNYSVANENTNGTHVEQVNFQENIARPALGPAMEATFAGGASSKKKEGGEIKALDAHVRQILAYHSMKLSTDGRAILDKMISKHMRCFAKHLQGKSSKKPTKVTEAKLGQTVHLKQFSIFL